MCEHFPKTLFLFFKLCGYTLGFTAESPQIKFDASYRGPEHDPSLYLFRVRLARVVLCVAPWRSGTVPTDFVTPSSVVACRPYCGVPRHAAAKTF